jgi:hypothetical protein
MRSDKAAGKTVTDPLTEFEPIVAFTLVGVFEFTDLVLSTKE